MGHKGTLGAIGLALVAGFLLGKDFLPSQPEVSSDTSSVLESTSVVEPQLTNTGTEIPVFLDEPKLDLGPHLVGASPSGEIHFTVLGDRPLSLLAASPTCGCLSTDFNGRVDLQPGQRHTIRVEYRPRNFPGTAEESIRLVFAGSPEMITVPVRAFFSRTVEAEPASIDADADLTGAITLRSLDGVPFEILSVNGLLPIFSDSDGPASVSHDLIWDLRAYNKDCLDEFGDSMPRWLIFETTHPSVPFVDVRVRNSECTKLDVPLSPTQEWYLGDHRFILGYIAAGGASDFVLPIRYFPGASRLEPISLVASTDPRFTLEVQKITQQFDQRDITLRLRASDALEPGFYRVPLVVRSAESGDSQTCVALLTVPS